MSSSLLCSVYWFFNTISLKCLSSIQKITVSFIVWLSASGRFITSGSVRWLSSIAVTMNKYGYGLVSHNALLALADDVKQQLPVAAVAIYWSSVKEALSLLVQSVMHSAWQIILICSISVLCATMAHLMRFCLHKLFLSLDAVSARQVWSFCNVIMPVNIMTGLICCQTVVYIYNRFHGVLLSKNWCHNKMSVWVRNYRTFVSSGKTVSPHLSGETASSRCSVSQSLSPTARHVSHQLKHAEDAILCVEWIHQLPFIPLHQCRWRVTLAVYVAGLASQQQLND